MQNKLKLYGFNNLTKALSFNIYDVCYAKTEREQREALRRGRRSFPGGELLLYEDTGSGARLLRIAPGGILETVADYGAENSASAAVFGRVLRDVLSGYPADGYGLVFFSHGSG